MPAFGRDGILSRDDIRAVVAYVRSLPAGASADDPGAALFADNCASCHGEDAKGMADLGAPNLTDAAWIYGGDAQTLFQTVHDGRQGWMPAWENRLPPVDRKILALYLLDLPGREP
jgi:cytochrome c oxidase cbb3-type subunit 3